MAMLASYVEIVNMKFECMAIMAYFKTLRNIFIHSERKKLVVTFHTNYKYGFDVGLLLIYNC